MGRLVELSNSLISINKITLTMSSLEIAELCEKRHDHVLRDIRIMFDNLGYPPKTGESYRLNRHSKKIPIYLLTKNQVICLVTGYNVKLRMRVVERWEQLELSNQISNINFKDPAEAARAWAEQYEAAEKEKAKRICLEIELEESLPKIQYCDIVNRCKSGVTISVFAKSMGVGPNKLRSQMKELGFLTRDGMPMQKFINCGYFEVQEIFKNVKGRWITNHIVLITSKGRQWIYKKLMNKSLMSHTQLIIP